METRARTDLSNIIKDNEQAIAQSMFEGHHLQAYLLIHALVEALLRVFLRVPEEKELTFDRLIHMYRSYLNQERHQFPTFIDELTQFNRRRNQIVHRLWRTGQSFTNLQTEVAARAAVQMYGLFIEWLETFDPEISQIGFKYDEGS